VFNTDGDWAAAMPEYTAIAEMTINCSKRNISILYLHSGSHSFREETSYIAFRLIVWAALIDYDDFAGEFSTCNQPLSLRLTKGTTSFELRKPLSDKILWKSNTEGYRFA
jgi:hypothetical protein